MVRPRRYSPGAGWASTTRSIPSAKRRESRAKVAWSRSLQSAKTSSSRQRRPRLIASTTRRPSGVTEAALIRWSWGAGARVTRPSSSRRALRSDRVPADRGARRRRPARGRHAGGFHASAAALRRDGRADARGAGDVAARPGRRGRRDGGGVPQPRHGRMEDPRLGGRAAGGPHGARARRDRRVGPHRRATGGCAAATASSAASTCCSGCCAAEKTASRPHSPRSASLGLTSGGAHFGLAS
jgi:hypothetical protein